MDKRCQQSEQTKTHTLLLALKYNWNMFNKQVSKIILREKLEQLLILKKINLSLSYYSDHKWRLLVDGNL